MGTSRYAARLAVASATLSLLAAPVVAQSANRGAIDELNTQLLYVALPLVLFVELTLVYAIYRFRDNDDPEPTVDDPALEVTWTGATAVILVFVGVSGYFVMTNPYLTPPVAAQDASVGDADTVEIEVVAYQWGWEFRYDDPNVTTTNRVVIPANTDVRFTLETEDVIHSLFVPDLGIKQDVIPGQETVARTRVTDPGNYTIYCSEFCGAGHSRMGGTVVVLNRSEYGEWVEDQAGGEPNASTESNAGDGESDRIDRENAVDRTAFAKGPGEIAKFAPLRRGST